MLRKSTCTCDSTWLGPTTQIAALLDTADSYCAHFNGLKDKSRPQSSLTEPMARVEAPPGSIAPPGGGPDAVSTICPTHVAIPTYGLYTRTP